MYRARQELNTGRRRAVILMVVVILLTLFAVIGIAFVFYSAAEATSSRIFREAQAAPVNAPNQSATSLLDYFLANAIYPADDAGGTYSAMRGHELARTMYGWDYDPNNPATTGSNVKAYNGLGRWHYQYTAAASGPAALMGSGQDDYNLVNYQYFPTDGFVRDPERNGFRADPTQPLGQYRNGYNPPYTYTDNNNMAMAAVAADGTVLMPSFYRSWTGFGTLDPSNPNWTTAAAGTAWLKYAVLRPRPADNYKDPTTGQFLFPAPVSAGGDVKNLIGSPGTLIPGAAPGTGTLVNEDSSWMDLGAPVQQLADGRYFKPLFAPLIMPVDNRVDLNVHGNIRLKGQSPTPPYGPHGSNQGWGKWEVNLGRVLSIPGQNKSVPDASGTNPEWPKLFVGTPAGSSPMFYGRYGQDGQPSWSGISALAGTPAPGYANVDYDAANETSTPPYAASSAFSLPGQNGWPMWSTFPQFAPTPASDNGWGNGSGPELANHPSLYDSQNPSGDDHAFAISDMLALVGDMTGTTMTSNELGQLCPNSFADPSNPGPSLRRRNLTTVISGDVDAPGATPYIYDPNASPYTYNYLPGSTPPWPFGQAILTPQQPFPAGPPPVNGSEYQADGRAGVTIVDWRLSPDGTTAPSPVPMTRLDLDRTLPDFPGWPAPPSGGQYSATDPNYVSALKARQQFAGDLFLRLVKVTGAWDLTDPNAATAPSPQQVDALRWLAQLSANIVDYIDDDDYMTPFNWLATDAVTGMRGLASPKAFALIRQAESTELGWVFGTELPRVLLNEVYAEYQPVAGGGNTVSVWTELLNPLYTDPLLSAGGAAVLQNTASTSPYQVYEIVLAGPSTGIRAATNVLGDPDSTAPYPLATGGTAGVVNDQTPALGFTNVPTLQPANGNYNMQQNPQNPPVGFYLVGPGAIPTVPNTNPSPLVNPTLTAPGMAYTVGNTPPPNPTVLLRRLANPFLPPQPTPTLPNYNPYVTVDYVENVPVNNATPLTGTAADQRYSVGRIEPYAASQFVPQKPLSSPNVGEPQHTFLAHNYGNNGGAAIPSVGDPLLRLPFDWLVHLDRQLISPMELLHVSMFKPHELTQQFMTGTPTAPALFQQQLQLAVQDVPQGGGLITNTSSRLYRIFEYLECHDRAFGEGAGARLAGKININMIWDPETLFGLCDSATANANSFTDSDVQTMYSNMLATRNANAQSPITTGSGSYVLPSQNDMPFWSMAAPFVPAGSGDTQFPNGSTIANTFLRPPAGGGPSTPRLFQATSVSTHPYLQNTVLNKLFNNITTRSNVFALWLTVGFFEVKYQTLTINGQQQQLPQLAAELVTPQGTIRHRMFAIIDRTHLCLDPQLAYSTTQVGTPSAPGGPPSPPPGLQVIQLGSPNGITPVNGALTGTTTANTMPIAWSITPGSTLIVDTGASQEYVQVQSVNTANNTVTAFFQRPHTPSVPVTVNGTPTPAYLVTIPGNPGPQPAFDLNNPAYASIVPYFVVLQ